MYQIKCDDYVLYDPRDDELVLLNPKCKLEVNTVGEGSFTILKQHPYYDKLKRLKSIFEIRQNDQVIFRGRMTNDSRDFSNCLTVDLEGVLGFTNDTIIEPFSFPADSPDAESSENIVRYFLQWILDKHNAQVEDWQTLKLGTVTVADPNNYISRSSSEYDTTWNTLKSKLFESTLGGYLCIRYESDGNYVDYLNEFNLTNTQTITFGENLLDIVTESDATNTYSAILPIGVRSESEGEKSVLTLESLEDGDLTDDLVKVGKFIYSKSAKDAYGWVCVPPDESKWNDVTDVNNLKRKAMEYLSGTAMKLSNTITIKAVDLSFTDDEIQSFRVYRNVLVNSPVHGVSNESFQLTTLDIDILNPQNTTITLGDTRLSLIGINNNKVDSKIEEAKNEISTDFDEKIGTSIGGIQNTILEQRTLITSDCQNIIMAALESYVETGDYSKFQETVSSQLSIMADQIEMNFTTTTESIKDVGGDLQAEITERKKYINFSENGITIGSGENAMTLELDNDMIKFKKNNIQFGWWDGIDFHTGNIVVDVDEKAQFGNFAFIPRSDGSLMFLKVGG
jgi:hypothetical protein